MILVLNDRGEIKTKSLADRKQRSFQLHFCQNASDGPHVDRLVVPDGAEQQFGGAVSARGHLSGVTSVVSAVIGQQQTAQAEIGYFQHSLGTDQQIGRFQVLNNKTERVARRYAVRQRGPPPPPARCRPEGVSSAETPTGERGPPPRTLCIMLVACMCATPPSSMRPYVFRWPSSSDTASSHNISGRPDATYSNTR